jgi:hypothetical protein
VAGIRDGRLAFVFPSDRLIEGGCYPKRGSLESDFAQDRWQSYADGDDDRASEEGKARHWFSMFDRGDALHDLYVGEHFLPVRAMDTLLVLLTIDDDDLFSNGDGDSEDED